MALTHLSFSFSYLPHRDALALFPPHSLFSPFLNKGKPYHQLKYIMKLLLVHPPELLVVARDDGIFLFLCKGRHDYM